MDPTCPFIKNLLLLDSDGKRVAVKYFCQDWPTAAEQSSFERSLWSKTIRSTARGEAEVVLFDNFLVVYKFLGDLFFVVTSSQDENEAILHAVLQAFSESISILFRQQVEKKTILENYDLVLLVMDEIVDGGVILETEPEVVASRVLMRAPDTEGSVTTSLTEQSLSHAFATVRESVARSLLR